MNLKKWNALPKDIQKTFEDVSREWIDVHGKAWDTSDADGRAFTLSLGNQIIELTPKEAARWKKAVRPAINEYIKDTEAKGLKAKKAVKTAEDLIAKYSKKK
jgi:TRAP-type C4-dicarboxylate transport system substrate-binding protein